MSFSIQISQNAMPDIIRETKIVSNTGLDKGQEESKHNEISRTKTEEFFSSGSSSTKTNSFSISRELENCPEDFI